MNGSLLPTETTSYPTSLFSGAASESVGTVISEDSTATSSVDAAATGTSSDVSDFCPILGIKLQPPAIRPTKHVAATNTATNLPRLLKVRSTQFSFL